MIRVQRPALFHLLHRHRKKISQENPFYITVIKVIEFLQQHQLFIGVTLASEILYLCHWSSPWPEVSCAALLTYFCVINPWQISQCLAQVSAQSKVRSMNSNPVYHNKYSGLCKENFCPLLVTQTKSESTTHTLWLSCISHGLSCTVPFSFPVFTHSESLTTVL